jgi:hypothetical protein
MAVDPVPHHLRHEPPDLAEAGGAIELRHSHGHLVAAHLGHQGAALGADEVRLAGGRPDPRVRLHALDEQLEIPRREVQVQVQLAQVLESVEVDSLEARAERLDHPRADIAASTVGSAQDPEVGQLRGVLLQDRRRRVGGSVVDHDQQGGGHGLRRNGVQGPAHELRLITAGRDQHVPACPAHEVVPH